MVRGCPWTVCYLFGHQCGLCPAQPPGSEIDNVPWLVFEGLSACSPAVPPSVQGLTYLSFKGLTIIHIFFFNLEWLKPPNKWIHTYCWNDILGVGVSPNNTAVIHYVSINKGCPSVKTTNGTKKCKLVSDSWMRKQFQYFLAGFSKRRNAWRLLFQLKSINLILLCIHTSLCLTDINACSNIFIL